MTIFGDVMEKVMAEAAAMEAAGKLDKTNMNPQILEAMRRGGGRGAFDQIVQNDSSIPHDGLAIRSKKVDPRIG